MMKPHTAEIFSSLNALTMNFEKSSIQGFMKQPFHLHLKHNTIARQTCHISDRHILQHFSTVLQLHSRHNGHLSHLCNKLLGLEQRKR